MTCTVNIIYISSKQTTPSPNFANIQTEHREAHLAKWGNVVGVASKEVKLVKEKIEIAHTQINESV